MKLFLIIVAIFMASNEGVKAEVDYDRLASLIQTNITTLNADLSKVDDKVQLLHGHIITIADSIDFRLSSNPQISQLRNALKARQLHKGILDCVNIFDEKTKTLLTELKESFVTLVDNHLNVMKITLFNTRKELYDVSQSLTGTSLLHELKICVDTPDVCKITTEYPNTLTNASTAITSIDTILKTLPDTVLDTAISPSIPDKVDTVVYKPVNACINKLKAYL